MSLTPTRTRRTRKDSSSSIEKQVVTTPTITKTQVPEVISEEPEISTKSTKDGSKTSDNESTSQTPIRQSPRLIKNKSRNSNSSTQDEARNYSVESNNEPTKTTESDKNISVKPDVKSEPHTNIIKETDSTNSDKNRLSVSSCDLIRNLEDKPKKSNSISNKSLSETYDSNKIKSKRHRTKSWTTLTNDSSIKEDFYNDKDEQKLGDNLKKKTLNSGSGDNMHIHDSAVEDLNCSQNKISSSGKKKKRETISDKCAEESEVTNLFQKHPSEITQTIIVMEDSDSNPLQINLPSNNINEDQCVPVVDHELENKGQSPEFNLSASFNKNKNESVVSKVINTSNTCEPMDVDETLPECLPNLSTKGSENQEKSLLHNTLETNSSMMNKTSNKSNLKSSTGLSTSQNLENSNTENKSTLVLSQLKDMYNSENKSPKLTKKEQLLQSSNLLNITQENENRKMISLNYLTSTPLQHKADLGDTGKNKSNNIFDNNISKSKDITPKKNVSEIADRSELNSEAESESDEALKTSKTSNLLDDEAEDASDNYESGDSQDEDEKQYEKDNEIVEKGETLTSEDELSNDSDYEKDSFVVTSDEEDNELLSGSGEDLSMSDNELKMNPKSKKKYNAKKLKEQKQASREMYESRHKLNTSKKDHSSTSKIGVKSCARLDSTNSENSEDNIKFTKKNKRMRLDSTATDSINISKIENTDTRKRDMDMSVSSLENILKEKEIIISEVTTENICDPLALHIKEENISMKEKNVSIDFVDADAEKGNISNTNTTKSKSLDSENPLEGSDNETSSYLSSEDENIAQNYNDMLKDLKVKTANHSLNIEKKSSPPIVDHLNITQTKALKKRNKSLQKENSTTNLKDQDKNSTENWSVTNYVNQEPDQNSSGSGDSASISDKKQFKFGDCSLNLENRSQKKSKLSLVDQLNLTQGNKKSKKNEKRKSKNINTNENVNNDDSSDSIDLKLLFSEDSINSSDLNKENIKNAENDTDNFIPLKKAEAKTDVRAIKDLDDNAEPPFFVDTIGNQPLDSSGEKEIVVKKNEHKGNHQEESYDDDSNEGPLEISYKKEENEKFVKKNKEENIDVDETDHGTPPQSLKKLNKSLSKDLSQMEDISLTKDNKKKNTSASFNVSNLDVLFSVENLIETSNYKSSNKTPSSEKNKMKKFSEQNESDVEVNNSEVSLNKSISKTPKSDKKKKKLSVSKNSETLNLVDKTSDEILNDENSINESIAKTPGSERKKIRKFLEPNESDVELKNSAVTLNKSISKTSKSEKKKKKLSMSENSETLNLVDKTSDENSISESIARTPGSERKKIRKLLEPNESDVELKNSAVTLNKSISKTPKSEKKKKKLSMSENSETFNLVDKISDGILNEENSIGKSIAKTPGSEKKKMRQLLEPNESGVELKNCAVTVNKSINKTSNSEKKKKKLSMSENSETFNLVDKISDGTLNEENSMSESIAKTPGSEKKKKRKLLEPNEPDVDLKNSAVTLNKSINKTPNSEKKKKQLSMSKNSETYNLVDKISVGILNEESSMRKSISKSPGSEKKKMKNLSQSNISDGALKNIETVLNNTDQITDVTPTIDGDITNSKKRKRSSVHLHDAASEGDLSKINVAENSLIVSNKKKRKISQKSEENDAKDILYPEKGTENNIALNTKVNKTINPDVQPNMSQKTVRNKKCKESSDPTSRDLRKLSEANQRNVKEVLNERKHKDDNESVNLKPKNDKNKKRKNRDDDNDTNETLKIRKENSFDHIHISRLPPSILNKLNDKPNKVKVASNTQNVVSTTEFEVEVTRKRRNKPSNYLEESIYINDDESMEEQKKKTIIKKPKVLPFLPTATTSNCGYTTNFTVNVIPQEIKFVAQSNNVNSFKNEYLYGKKIKRLGTYDLYKKNRNIKMSKF